MDKIDELIDEIEDASNEEHEAMLSDYAPKDFHRKERARTALRNEIDALIARAEAASRRSRKRKN